MDIGYIISIYTVSHKKMPPEDEREVDLAGVENLPSKNKPGWKIHTFLSQCLLYLAKKKKKKEERTPFLWNR